mgnify:CR=1 FL=1
MLSSVTFFKRIIPLKCITLYWTLMDKVSVGKQGKAIGKVRKGWWRDNTKSICGRAANAVWPHNSIYPVVMKHCWKMVVVDSYLESVYISIWIIMRMSKMGEHWMRWRNWKILIGNRMVRMEVEEIESWEWVGIIMNKVSEKRKQRCTWKTKEAMLAVLQSTTKLCSKFS